jgi:hypothetical protein
MKIYNNIFANMHEQLVLLSKRIVRHCIFTNLKEVGNICPKRKHIFRLTNL